MLPNPLIGREMHQKTECYVNNPIFLIVFIY